MTRLARVLAAVLALTLLLLALLLRRGAGPLPGRLSDRVELISPAERQHYEDYLRWVERESGVDIRILLVPESKGESLQQFALSAMRKLGVGRATGGRGLVIVYDTLDRAMRIEVGPRLQGIVTDAFAGYLMREHVSAFFGGGRPELGLRTTLFMIHWRIRMARLGEEYDPSFEEYVRDVRRLAAGGGASGRIALGTGLAAFINSSADSAARAYFRPQPTIDEAYRRHQEWLALGGGQVDVSLLTLGSQAYLRQLPLSPAFNAYLLATEYGRAYAIDERGDVAMLYYTDDPLLSPKFFRRTPQGWQMDVVAEVANSQEAAGLWYTWRLRVSGDDYSRTFADRYMPVELPGGDEFYRVAGGDNRPLTIRGDSPAVESELAARPKRDGPSRVATSGVEFLTVFQAANHIRQARGRPVVVVLYGTWNEETRGQFASVVRAARHCEEQGATFIAFQKDANERAIAELPEFLARAGAPFSALQLYPWRPGLLDATMGRLGIQVGQRWRPPLVAVLDPRGGVVWQQQGVSDWGTVESACDRATRGHG